MSAGRPPKPTNLHVLQGTRPSTGARLTEAEPALLTPAQALQPPPHLSEPSAAVWREIAPILQRTRLLTELDVLQLELACDAMADYRMARTQRGSEITVIGVKGSEALSQLAVATQMFRKAASEHLAKFGMSPADRTRAMTGQAQPDLFDSQPAASGPMRHFR